MRQSTPEEGRSNSRLNFFKGAALFTLIAGLLFTILAFQLYRDWEMQKVRFAFHRSADRHISRLNKQIDAIEHLMDSVKSLYLSSDVVEEHEFKDFVVPLIKRNAAVSQVAWIARQSGNLGDDSERPEYQTEHNPTRLNEQNESFEAMFMVPDEGLYQPGIDPFANGRCRQAANKARDTGKIAMCRENVLDESHPEKNNRHVFQLFEPVYVKGETTATLNDKRRKLSGFISTLVLLPPLLDQAWYDLDNGNLSIFFFDQPPSGNKQLFLSYPLNSRRNRIDTISLDSVIDQAAEHQSAIIHSADRKWHLLIAANKDYITSNREKQVYAVPFTLLVCTILVTIFVHSSSQKKEQLALANEQLTAEIHERQTAQEALEKERDLSNTLIQSSPLFFVAADRNGTVQIVNRALIDATGYTTEDLIGKNYLEALVCRHERPSVIEAARKLFEDNTVMITETLLKTKNEDSSPVLVEWHLTPVSQLRGQSSFFLGLGIDISEKRRKEEALKESEELKEKLRQAQKMESIGTLAGGIAHDFNNILSIIIGFGELGVMMQDSGETNIKNCLDEILTAAGRAKDLVGQILTFSRQSDEVRKPLQPNRIVKEAIKFLRASIPSTIDIQTRLDEQTGIISANPTQMHQIIMNLCTNASHAMKEMGGVIQIELTNTHLDEKATAKDPHLLPGPYVKLTVKDNGHGISRKNLARIFDPYFTTKEQGEGTGLGLAISADLVRGHGGRLELRRTGPEGTVFAIFLPKAVISAPEAAA